MIAMAHKLKIKVIAEGVETHEQREQLEKMGCDFAQGYLLSKPLSAEAFDTLLQKREWTVDWKTGLSLFWNHHYFYPTRTSRNRKGLPKNA